MINPVEGQLHGVDRRVSRDVKVRLALALLAVQLLLLWFSMPLDRLISGDLFFHIDNPYHLYQLELGRALLAEGRWVAYDPYFGAGSVGGLPTNVSARFSLLFALLMPAKAATSTIYAVYVLVCALLAPLSIAVLGSRLRWSQPSLVLAAIVGLLLWWVGVFRWYHTAGMVSFVCASYLALPYSAWVFSLCDPQSPLSRGKLVLAGVAGGAGLWLHPLFCVPVVLLFASFLLLGSMPRRPWSLLGRALVITAVAVVVSLPWVLALLRGGGLQTVAEQPYKKAVGLGVIWNSLGFGAAADTGAWIHLLVAGACMLAALPVRGADRSSARPFLLSGLALLLFAGFGGANATLAYLQPNRFIGPAYLLLGMAAALYLSGAMALAKAPGHRAGRLCLLVVGALVSLFLARELYREVAPGPQGRHGKAPPEMGSAPPVLAKLETWIRHNTSADARILFETSLARVHGNSHAAGYLAAATRREFMGAAYPFFLPQISCWDRSCFGRPLSAMPPAYFLRAIQTYNVGWIIAHSSELKAFLQQLSGVVQLAEFDGVALFQVQGVRTFVESGSGTVGARDFNRIEVAGANGPTLTLRYTWVPGLETVPPSRVEPYVWSADFPPLIRIIDPPPAFVLRMAD